MQRRSSKGQSAIVPGIVSSRNPHEPWVALGSIRFTTTKANGMANTSPQAKYAPIKIKNVAAIMAKTR